MTHHSTHHAAAHSASEHGPTLKSYCVGFVLAVVLTVIPFAMVMHGGFSKEATIITIAVMAAVQMFVHVIYFLHLDRSSAQRLNVQSGLFTVLLIGIVIVGSLWVMHNLASYMMAWWHCAL